MHSQWSGGHYSVFCAFSGIYLLLHFIHLTVGVTNIYSSAGVAANVIDGIAVFSVSPTSSHYSTCHGLLRQLLA
jgi:hypothetical protein